MNVIVLVPARMASSRFPGKPMKKINGVPMIEMIYNNLVSLNNTYDLAIATCDKIIDDHITSIGGVAIMTSMDHDRASDRCAEALDKLEIKNNIKYDIVVMVQGDEPLIKVDDVELSISALIDNENNKVVNLIEKIRSEEEFNDHNTIKCVFDKEYNALYFSRSKIPYNGFSLGNAYKQVCVIPFRAKFLREYLKMDQSLLEIVESVDMMRVLENGINVKLVEINKITHAVDTESDIKLVENLLNQ
jgi:3-deoxy-manno-octulosonate cytidylyltransferase (CMP-KDO synthetase)